MFSRAVGSLPFSLMAAQASSWHRAKSPTRARGERVRPLPREPGGTGCPACPLSHSVASGCRVWKRWFHRFHLWVSAGSCPLGLPPPLEEVFVSLPSSLSRKQGCWVGRLTAHWRSPQGLDDCLPVSWGTALSPALGSLTFCSAGPEASATTSDALLAEWMPEFP